VSSTKVFNPETSPIEGTMLLEASAGTGKTYALERMVARLVGRDENPLRIDKILVVTFTNRAAREMKERIRSLLALRAGEGERSPEERERYRGAVSGFDRSAIYTIHGFCQMVLSSWPFESASPFRQELVPGGVLESAELRSWIAGLEKDELDGMFFVPPGNRLEVLRTSSRTFPKTWPMTTSRRMPSFCPLTPSPPPSPLMWNHPNYPAALSLWLPMPFFPGPGVMRRLKR